MTEQDLLTQRRTWFRFFPEGSIEFIMVTRVLALVLLVALGVARGSQVYVVLTGLAVVLWLDYLIMLWWAVQTSLDLDTLFSESRPDLRTARRRRIRLFWQAALPSVPALLIVAPWDDVARVFFRIILSPTVTTFLAVALPVLYLLAILVGQKALKKAHLKPVLWNWVFLVPGLHWFAMHRMVKVLCQRLAERAVQKGVSIPDGADPPMSVVIADVTWVLSVIPWSVILAVFALRGSWPGGMPYAIGPACGTLFVVLFAIADTAALEGVQQRFIKLVGSA